MDEPGIGFWLFRIAASIVGVLLLYAAIFTYPEERKGLHNRLEDWWLHLHDASDQALKRHVAFIQMTARTAKSGFDWLFGAPLSSRFFIASGLLSMCTFAIGMLSIGGYGWAVPTGITLFSAGILAFALMIGREQDKLAAEFERTRLENLDKYADLLSDRLDRDTHEGGFIKSGQSLLQNPEYWSSLDLPYSNDPLEQSKNSWWEDAFSSENLPKLLLPSALAVLSFSSTGFVFADAQEKGVGEGIFLLALLIAFICDAVCILVTIYLLEKISDAKSAVIAAAYFLVDAFLAGAMLAIPWMLFIWVAEQGTTLAHLSVFVAAANLSNIVPSIVFLLVAATALAHRLFWPFLLRPFYNLIHAEKITKPKTLGAVGLACFSVWIEIPESYETSFKNLLNFF